MPNRGDRGGAQTRARISAVATDLFLARGFDDVTIADVAAAAGVSKVTVFAHFDRKEDLLLDRLPDVLEVLTRTVTDRPADVSVVTAFHRAARKLAADRHVLSGLTGDIEPFMRTILGSPALIARARAFQFEAEATLAALLTADDRFTGDAPLTAALLLATYRTVAAATINRRLSGDSLATVTAAHLTHLDAAFGVLETGLKA